MKIVDGCKSTEGQKLNGHGAIVDMSKGTNEKGRYPTVVFRGEFTQSGRPVFTITDILPSRLKDSDMQPPKERGLEELLAEMMMGSRGNTLHIPSAFEKQGLSDSDKEGLSP